MSADAINTHKHKPASNPFDNAAINTMTDKDTNVSIYSRIIKRIGGRFMLMCIYGISAHEFTFDYW